MPICEICKKPIIFSDSAKMWICKDCNEGNSKLRGK